MLGLAPAFARDLMAMSPADFSAQPELNRPVAVDSLDRDLLAAAIFHETNRVRLLERLPALPALAKLNAAAEIQSHVGIVSRPPSHTNPFADISDPFNRVSYVGLKPYYVSENIALVSIYNVGGGSEFGVARLRGKNTFVDLKTGQELQVHTYDSYARMVVRAWLDSPGHRKNLLDPTVKFIGCSVYPSTGNYGEGLIFSVQVFYTPKKN
jgi:uncharacterized protein YkwD